MTYFHTFKIESGTTTFQPFMSYVGIISNYPAPLVAFQVTSCESVSRVGLRRVAVFVIFGENKSGIGYGTIFYNIMWNLEIPDALEHI